MYRTLLLLSLTESTQTSVHIRLKSVFQSPMSPLLLVFVKLLVIVGRTCSPFELRP